MAFDAKYPGNCACCGARFGVGDPVTFCDDSIVIEGHILSTDVDGRISDKEDICQTCFVVKPKGQRCFSCD